MTRPRLIVNGARSPFGLRDFWRGPALVLTACWLHAAAVTPWAADDRPKREALPLSALVKADLCDAAEYRKASSLGPEIHNRAFGAIGEGMVVGRSAGSRYGSRRVSALSGLPIRRGPFR